MLRTQRVDMKSRVGLAEMRLRDGAGDLGKLFGDELPQMLMDLADQRRRRTVG